MKSLRYQIVPKSQGKDMAKWKRDDWVAIESKQIDVLIRNRYGSSNVDFIRKQLAEGRVVELAWGFLRQEPKTNVAD